MSLECIFKQKCNSWWKREVGSYQVRWSCGFESVHLSSSFLWVVSWYGS
ncbi:hypothetical protein Hanom_Chr14g01304421 [Helianthus anomalus]